MPVGGTPLIVHPSPGIVTRVGQAARYVISAIKPDTWMSPLQPLVPLSPETGDRAWDYPVGYNINYIPRMGHSVTFAELHALARSCEIIRLCIETRKDQISALSYNIGFKDPSNAKKKDSRIEKITEFFQSPDKVHDFHDWLRPILEELFVTDAVTIYRRKTRGGDLYSLDQLSGSTIKPLIDDTGRRPVSPSPAYQQILKGVPKCDYSTDELMYTPRNIRIESPYGYGPIEQIIIYAKQQIERAASQLYYFTVGSLPDGFLTAPKTFSPDQIAGFDKKLNALLSGNLGARRQLSVMPDGTDFKQVKQPLMKDDFDEWLARIACYAFSLPPTPFIKELNRSTSETSQTVAKDEGLAPLLLWIKRKIDYIISVDFESPDLCFRWDTQAELDPVTKANIDVMLTKGCIKSINQVRLENGYDPVPGGEQPMLATATGWVGLPGSDVEVQQDDRNAAKIKEKNIQQQEPNNTGNKLKDDAEKLRKAVRHKPLPFDHATLLTSQEAIVTTVYAALEKIKKSTLDYVKKHPIAKLAKAEGDEHDYTPEEIAGEVYAQTGSVTSTNIEIIELISKELSTVAKDIAPQIETIAKAAGENVITQLGVGTNDSLTEVNTRAAAWAEDHAANLISEITETTRNRIQGTISQALSEGWAHDELESVLESLYGFSLDRAELIAVTEANNANNHGALEGGYILQAQGVTVKKKWLSDIEPCPICTTNADDGWIRLDTQFTSGHQAPTAHPRCLCSLMILDENDIKNL